MEVRSVNTYSPNFQASIKLTPFAKNKILKMSRQHQSRLFKALEELKSIGGDDELLLTRKIHNGETVAVLTNLRTGAMIANFNTSMQRFSSKALDLIEKVVEGKNGYFKRIFSKNGVVIDDSISDVLKATRELSNHPPVPSQKLKHKQLNKEEQHLLKQFETVYPKKELSFMLKNDQKLFIKRYDEGYVYYLCDRNNMPTGRYFTATYTKDGFCLNYDDKFISEVEVDKCFRRYTAKAVEKLS